MKKLFTLVAVAACTASAYAQDVYNAIVDGKLAPEFAAVAGEDGGVANNSADGKSIITITAGAATVSAVGGTTPGDKPGEQTGGAQDITPGNVIDEEKHIYEVSSVQSWKDISWEKKNQGDIDFWYITGTGNPYVGMNCVEISKEGEWTGAYKADYVFYEPDGSLGMPITGLYYTFTASKKGAFKVKVWANKGNRKTFVVNAATQKAERLYASGYINGVNDENGKKKLLSVDEVDAEHHKYIWGTYDALVEKGKGETQSQEDYDAKLAEAKENAEAMEIERQFVIGNGNQNFWGWLTFDVEPGEVYWVFQHSSQIGFGGFEFHEGLTAEELISGIEAPYIYTTNFGTYEDETGETVTWKGETAKGDGAFMRSEEEGAPFGSYYENTNMDDWRLNYCVLPEDVLAHSAKTQGWTLGVWMKVPEGMASADYASAPVLCAYDQQKEINEAPLFALQYDGTAKLDNGTQCDYSDEMNTAGKNTILSGEADWLADHKWHYYTAVFNADKAQVFIDGVLKNEWNCGEAQSGLFEQGDNLKYVCLGGNQLDEVENGYDAPFAFASLLIKNSPMSAGEIKAQMTADFPTHEEYWSTEEKPETKKGDVNGDGSIDVADISAIITVMAGGAENKAADVNGDGSVDVADISSVITIMAGGTIVQQ